MAHQSAHGSSVADVALGGNPLFVAGYTDDDGPDGDFVIRAYDIRNDGTAP